MLLVSGTEYRNLSPNPSQPGEIGLQTTLNAGTAIFYIRDVDSAGWSSVATLTDVPERIYVPDNWFYKVELTGSATVYGSWVS